MILLWSLNVLGTFGSMTIANMYNITHLLLSVTERLEDIPYVDRPDIALPASSDAKEGANTSESVSMPFRYVKGNDGKPVLPKVSNLSSSI